MVSQKGHCYIYIRIYIYIYIRTYMRMYISFVSHGVVQDMWWTVYYARDFSREYARGGILKLSTLGGGGGGGVAMYPCFDGTVRKLWE